MTDMKKNMSRVRKRGYRLIMAMAFVALSMVFFSCKDGGERERRQATNLSPLETVRRLAEENEQFAKKNERPANKNKQFTKSKPVDSIPYPPELKAIRGRGHVIFAMHSHEQPPFFYKDGQTGELIGLDVEIGYEIANRLGVSAVFNRDATSFDGVIMKVANREADIGLSMLSITIPRSELVRYTVPYITFRQALLVNRLEFAKIGPEDHLARFIRNYRGTLGIRDNSSYTSFAETNFPGADIKAYDKWEQAVDALFAGDVLAVYSDECEILIVKATRKNASILMKPVFIIDKPDPLAMAVSADAPMLQNWLNVFLDDYLLRNKYELIPSRLIERHSNSGN